MQKIIVMKKQGDSVSVIDYILQDNNEFNYSLDNHNLTGISFDSENISRDKYKSKDGDCLSTLDEECFVKLYVDKTKVEDLMDYWEVEFWLDKSLLNNIVIDTLGYRKHGKFTSVTDILKAKHANK